MAGQNAKVQVQECHSTYRPPAIPCFTQFPTPQSLAKAQKYYSRQGYQPQLDGEGNPYPFPSTTTKDDVFDLKAFEQLDLHALQTPVSMAMSTLDDLVEYLTKPANNNIERLRVIFRWITAQDINSVQFDDTEPKSNSAGFYLKNIRDEKGSYPELFIEMCKCANIKCEKISGTVKGTSYKIGDHIPHSKGSNPFYGSWVGVLLDGQWRLIDPHWASRHVKGSRTGEWALLDDGKGRPRLLSTEEESKGELQYAYDEFYFLPDPYKFIYSHLPYEQQWQLLARPITLQEFEKMPFLKSTFLDLELHLINQQECVIHTSKGEAEIQVKLPSGRKYKISHEFFIFTGKGTSVDLENISLERYVFSEIFEGTLIIQISLPVLGKYRLDLFGKDAVVEGGNRPLCSYLLKSDKPNKDATPLPESNRAQWGPGDDTEEVGMHPVTHKRGRIEADDDGYAEIRFKCDKKTKFMHHLSSSDRGQKVELDSYVVHWMENEEVVIKAKLPKDGLYALSLYAQKECDKGTNTFSSVCDYLIHARKGAADSTPFPTVRRGFLGPLEEFATYGLSVMSHRSGLIWLRTSGEVEMQIGTPVPMKFLLNLHRQEKNDNVTEFSEYTFHQQEDSNTTFSMVFPKKGIYKFSLYGRPVSVEGTSLPLLCNYVIIVLQHKKKCHPFPSTHGLWGNGCHLIKPRSRYLDPNSTIDFAVKIPDVARVATIDQNNSWTYLKKNDNGIWKGDVKTGEEGTTMKLSACLDPNGDTFSCFLEFKVHDATMDPDVSDSVGEDACTSNPKDSKEEPLREKLLSMLEAAYPNALTLDYMVSMVKSDEATVANMLQNLVDANLVKKMDENSYMRHVRSDGKNEIKLVKQMPVFLKESHPTVAIVTYQYYEKIAVDAMITDKTTFMKYKGTGGESNVYTLGFIGPHRVVSTKLSQLGTSRDAMISAGNTTTRLLGTFSQIDHVFLVGCGGGMPQKDDNKVCRLGDVVASALNKMGKMYVHCEKVIKDKEKPVKYTTRSWAPQVPTLQKLCSQDQIRTDANKGGVPWEEFIKEGQESLDGEEVSFARPDTNGSVPPAVHIGTVGSGGEVVEHREFREDFANRHSILCYDAGFHQVLESIHGSVKESFIIIRGISDFHDGTKDREWQPYAALAAAAYMKMLLLVLPQP